VLHSDDVVADLLGIVRIFTAGHLARLKAEQLRYVGLRALDA
jgi:hypothetical protein